MEDTKNKGYEVDDAKKAEAEDKKEDKDIKKEEETGRSEKGYIKDDAEKAEKHDDEEDKDYTKYDIFEALKQTDFKPKYHDLLYKILTHPESSDYDSILNDKRLDNWKQGMNTLSGEIKYLDNPKPKKEATQNPYDLTKKKDMKFYK